MLIQICHNSQSWQKGHCSLISMSLSTSNWLKSPLGPQLVVRLSRQNLHMEVIQTSSCLFWSKDFPPDVDDGTNTSGCLLRLWGGKVWDTLLYSIVDWDGNELFNNVLLFPFRRCRYPHKIWYYTAVLLNLTSHLLHNLEAHRTWKCKISCTFLNPHKLKKGKVNRDKCPSYLPVTNDAF